MPIADYRNSALWSAIYAKMWICSWRWASNRTRDWRPILSVSHKQYTKLVPPFPTRTQNLFILSNPVLTHLHSNASKELLEGIKVDRWSIYYYYYNYIWRKTHRNGSILQNYNIGFLTFTLEPVAARFYGERQRSGIELKLDDRLAEVEKTEGESEISDALKARANYLTRIGDKVPISFLVWGGKL